MERTIRPGWGIEISESVEAGNGAEGLAELSSLNDRDAPVMDGLEFPKHPYSRIRQVPVIMTGAERTAGGRSAGRSLKATLGNRLLLRKPVGKSLNKLRDYSGVIETRLAGWAHNKKRGSPSPELPRGDQENRQ
jgi:hypothetical protein